MTVMTDTRTPDRARYNIASRSPWEPLRGYSRAVQVGDHLFISGTTAMRQQGDVVGLNDPYEQTKYILALIRHILTNRGFVVGDVVRTRLYVTQMARWDDYARAHREVFGNTRPASSIVQVQRLVDPRLLIEMEAEALRGCVATDDLTIEYPQP
jgi:enamine deaminase RidA (YjgF/YER057c/UK114 family)